jgi:hypothetical protein
MDETADTPTPPPSVQVAEVRYSLPELLRELTLERATGTFAMEKLDQTEIGKLFKNKAQRRAKLKK